MNAKMTPLLEGQMYFAYVSGIAFILVGVYLSYPPPTPASTASAEHLGAVVLLDRVAL